jgi:GAF domain-containing protein
VGRAEVDRLGAALAAEPDVARGLERLLTLARRVTAAEAGTVYLRRGEALEFAVVQNDVLAREIGEAEVRRRVGARPLSLRENSIASYVVLTRTTVNLRDAYEVPVDRPYTLLREVDRKADYRTRSMLALPLRDAGARVFGVLQLINALDRQGAVRPFTAEDQDVVQAMAAQAARLPGLATG